jgi:hypothetical protein
VTSVDNVRKRASDAVDHLMGMIEEGSGSPAFSAAGTVVCPKLAYDVCEDPDSVRDDTLVERGVPEYQPTFVRRGDPGTARRLNPETPPGGGVHHRGFV